MQELAAGDFDEVCRCPEVAAQLGSLDANRQAALKTFWHCLAAAVLLAAAAGLTLHLSGWRGWAMVAAALIFGLLLLRGSLPLARLTEDLKHPVLEKAAARCGMTYVPVGFEPPVYPQARKMLFGEWLTSETFSDLIHGTDSENRNYAVYEAQLLRQQGKSVNTVFSGQIYALQRSRGAGGTTVILPDRGIFNLFKPGGGMERVDLGFAPDFDSRFEVYSTAPNEARQLLFDSDLRTRLLALRTSGKLFAYLDPSEALVAVSGKNRFEPGSMFAATPGKERVRRMFDDARAAVATLGFLKRALG